MAEEKLITYEKDDIMYLAEKSCEAYFHIEDVFNKIDLRLLKSQIDLSNLFNLSYWILRYFDTIIEYKHYINFRQLENIKNAKKNCELFDNLGKSLHNKNIYEDKIFGQFLLYILSLKENNKWLKVSSWVKEEIIKMSDFDEKFDGDFDEINHADYYDYFHVPPPLEPCSY